MQVAISSSHEDLMTGRSWSSNSLGRSWTSIGNENLNSSLTLSRHWANKSRVHNDRLSSSLGQNDWNICKQEKNAAALAEAVRKGRIRHIQLLIEAGTDPNITDESGGFF